MRINSFLEYIMSLLVIMERTMSIRAMADKKIEQKIFKKEHFTPHTMSRCCSPLISMASTLTNEHRIAGKVTSNCMNK